MKSLPPGDKSAGTDCCMG